MIVLIHDLNSLILFINYKISEIKSLSHDEFLLINNDQNIVNIMLLHNLLDNLIQDV